MHGVPVFECGVINGNLWTVNQFLTNLEHLVSQTISVKIDKCQCTLTLGATVVEIATHTCRSHRHIGTNTNRCCATYIPTFATGGAQCGRATLIAQTGRICEKPRIDIVIIKIRVLLFAKNPFTLRGIKIIKVCPCRILLRKIAHVTNTTERLDADSVNPNNICKSGFIIATSANSVNEHVFPNSCVIIKHPYVA